MKTIKTWRERAGLPETYPLHMPTHVELAMQGEIADLRAAHAQQDAAPAGYKLVPLEPTPEMQQAGHDTPGAHMYNASYRAMVAAAPSAATGKAAAANAGDALRQGKRYLDVLEEVLQEIDAVPRMETERVETWACRSLMELAATSAADAKDAEPVTLMTEKQAEDWAWRQVQRDCKLHECSIGERGNFYGFFLRGWRYRAQYERQHPARAAIAASQPTGKTLFGLPIVIDDTVPPGQARFTSGRRTVVADIGSQVHPESALPSRTLDDHQQDCAQVAALGREALAAATNPRQKLADTMARMGEPVACTEPRCANPDASCDGACHGVLPDGAARKGGA